MLAPGVVGCVWGAGRWWARASGATHQGSRRASGRLLSPSVSVIFSVKWGRRLYLLRRAAGWKAKTCRKCLAQGLQRAVCELLWQLPSASQPRHPNQTYSEKHSASRPYPVQVRTSDSALGLRLCSSWTRPERCECSLQNTCGRGGSLGDVPWEAAPQGCCFVFSCVLSAAWPLFTECSPLRIWSRPPWWPSWDLSCPCSPAVYFTGEQRHRPSFVVLRTPPASFRHGVDLWQGSPARIEESRGASLGIGSLLDAQDNGFNVAGACMFAFVSLFIKRVPKVSFHKSWKELPMKWYCMLHQAGWQAFEWHS